MKTALRIILGVVAGMALALVLVIAVELLGDHLNCSLHARQETRLVRSFGGCVRSTTRRRAGSITSRLTPSQSVVQAE
jgi:hypothetical protein